VRRLAPRPLAEALGPLRRELAPATTLARVQEAWPAVAGPAAREAGPVSERAGTVTFECRSSVWAGELSLMSRDLIERLNAALGAPGEGGPVTALRFVTGASRTGS
jgi:predicted nucleic acid-binding Zn ribbon protein